MLAVVLALALQTQPAPDSQALLALHAKVMKAHVESDIGILLEDESADYVVANRGDITRPTIADRRDRLGPYLSRTRFTEYRDAAPPIVEVSPDGKLGWVIVKVTAKGVQTGPDGKKEDLAFTSAWIELYKKVDGVWKRTGNVSNFKP